MVSPDPRHNPYIPLNPGLDPPPNPNPYSPEPKPSNLCPRPSPSKSQLFRSYSMLLDPSVELIRDTPTKIDETLAAYFVASGAEGPVARVEGRITRVQAPANPEWLNPTEEVPTIVYTQWQSPVAIIFAVITGILLLIMIVPLIHPWPNLKKYFAEVLSTLRLRSSS